MIVKFNQIGRQPNPTFEGVQNGNTIIKGVGKTHSHSASVNVNGNRYALSDEIHKEKLNNKSATQVTDFISNGKRIGYIFPDIVEQKKILFFSVGYDYFECRFYDNSYQIYEVGLGANEHYICILRNNITLAIIHKHDIRINFRDNYTFYIENESNLELVSIVALYFDCIRYPDHGEITDGEKDNDSFLTIQKELNAKYDPTFIPKIKAMEGIMD